MASSGVPFIDTIIGDQWQPNAGLLIRNLIYEYTWVLGLIIRLCHRKQTLVGEGERDEGGGSVAGGGYVPYTLIY